MADDSAARLEDHRRQLATEIDRLAATEPGSAECRAAVDVVEARLQAMEAGFEQRLKPVVQVLGGATVVLGVVAAVLTTRWLLVFLLPVVAVGVLLVARPTYKTARTRLLMGVVAFVVALLCLLFGGVLRG